MGVKSLLYASPIVEDTSPKFDEGHPGHQPPVSAPPQVENITVEQLEGHVVAVLERLQANRGL